MIMCTNMNEESCLPDPCTVNTLLMSAYIFQYLGNGLCYLMYIHQPLCLTQAFFTS